MIDQLYSEIRRLENYNQNIESVKNKLVVARNTLEPAVGLASSFTIDGISADNGSINVQKVAIDSIINYINGAVSSCNDRIMSCRNEIRREEERQRQEQLEREKQAQLEKEKNNWKNKKTK